MSARNSNVIHVLQIKSIKWYFLRLDNESAMAYKLQSLEEFEGPRVPL